MTKILSIDIQTFLQKDTTKNFLSAAQTFVNLLEKNDISKEIFYRQAHTALAELYTAGQKLENIELKYSGSDYKCEKSDDELFTQKNINLISELDKDSFYWQIFDPTDSSDLEPTQGWLVDDFADIYRDLKIGLEQIKLNNDAAIEDAMFGFHFSFQHHWGNHCINALRALHYLWYEGKSRA